MDNGGGPSYVPCHKQDWFNQFSSSLFEYNIFSGLATHSTCQYFKLLWLHIKFRCKWTTTVYTARSESSFKFTPMVICEYCDDVAQRKIQFPFPLDRLSSGCVELPVADGFTFSDSIVCRVVGFSVLMGHLKRIRCRANSRWWFFLLYEKDTCHVSEATHSTKNNSPFLRQFPNGWHLLPHFPLKFVYLVGLTCNHSR